MKKVFDQFLRFHLPRLGLNWVRFKNRHTRRVIAQRIGEMALRSWDEYGLLLAEDPREQAWLRAALTATISRFWRNRAVFAFLEKTAFPTLLRALNPDEALVVWSAGAASGQEAFSVAAAYRGVPETARRERLLCVVATDLNGAALTRGSQDDWTRGELRELAPEARQRIFEPASFRPAIRNDLRCDVAFVQADLFAEPPVRFAHVILCRNAVMTYFERNARKQAIKRIIDVLKPGGYLVLGRKEKLPDTWARAWRMRHLGRRIYRLDASRH